MNVGDMHMRSVDGSGNLGPGPRKAKTILKLWSLGIADGSHSGPRTTEHFNCVGGRQSRYEFGMVRRLSRNATRKRAVTGEVERRARTGAVLGFVCRDETGDGDVFRGRSLVK